MSSENPLDEKRLVQEARNALFQHYSSKSTNQTGILIALSVALFSFSQTIRHIEVWSSLLRNLYYLAFLTAFSFLIIRSLGRLFCWGKMAELIISAKMVSEEDAKENLLHEKGLEESEAIPTYHMRLGMQCGGQLRKSMNPVLYQIHRLTRESRCYLLLLLLLAVFSFSIYRVLEASIRFVFVCAVVGMIVVIAGMWRFIMKQRETSITSLSLKKTIHCLRNREN